jgi:glycerol-3-phosphate dehydrogenase (NAD(P)+)
VIKTPLKIGAVGSGIWGTAMAAHFSRCGHDVILWGRDSATVDSINTLHESPRYLPGVKLPPNLRASTDLVTVVADRDIVVGAVPTQAIRNVFTPVANLLNGKTIVNLSKGLEMGTLKRVSEIFSELCPQSPYVILSGPSFAIEVAQQLPTAVTAASVSIDEVERIQRIFSNEYFRIYTSQDVVGVEIAGALKNVIAIASGIVVGLDLGYNAQAALINRGIAEITRLGRILGADLLTFLGLAGMGDLILTCTGPLSRNRRLGEAVGRGLKISQVQKELGGVAEGFYTAKSSHEFAKKVGVELPIINQVYGILYEIQKPQAALAYLMSRDLKEEWEMAKKP